MTTPKLSPSQRFVPLFGIFLYLILVHNTALAQDARAFQLNDGDRVVFLGNTFVERAIDYGHIEAALIAHWPDRTFTFRNLGWSGDDARGRARRFFGPVEDGFNHLRTHVEDLKPNVIFVAYGAMESFEGRAGLPEFEAAMHVLLDTLEKTKARIVLLSPVPQENLGPPMPDPKKNNENLKLYTESIEAIARKRKLWFIDLYSYMEKAMRQISAPLTDNGVHLNDEGYRQAAQGILSGMNLPTGKKSIQLDARGNILAGNGTRAEQVQPLGNGLLITLKDEALGVGNSLQVSVKDLFDGNYSLRINGRNLGTFSAREWAAGVDLPWTPEMDQVALLTNTIRVKNEFYFHKWRPQNETYLRGFRSREQGKHVVELEQFDPFIEREEQTIADLKRPRGYTLQLLRETEK